MMRNSVFLLSFLTVVFMASCAEIEPDTHIQSFSKLRKHLREVPNAFKTVPFWVWNDDMDREMIVEALQDFKEGNLEVSSYTLGTD
ncbi:hypothetical protein ACFLT1_01950 [Bacteroidota bacterium]